MYQIFLIQLVFESSDRVEFDLWGLVIRVSLNVKSQETKEIEVIS